MIPAEREWTQIERKQGRGRMLNFSHHIFARDRPDVSGVEESMRQAQVHTRLTPEIRRLGEKRLPNQRRSVSGTAFERGILIIAKTNDRELAKGNVMVSSVFNIHFSYSMLVPDGGMRCAEFWHSAITVDHLGPGKGEHQSSTKRNGEASTSPTRRRIIVSPLGTLFTACSTRFRWR